MGLIDVLGIDQAVWVLKHPGQVVLTVVSSASPGGTLVPFYFPGGTLHFKKIQIVFFN
jgi:hypothetical protein